jgi:rhamnogalacturonyl hydrolase YesR
VLLDALRSVRSRLSDELSLAPAARAERRRDRSRGLSADPGIDATIAATMDWLARAQDQSITHDGGVARHYSLRTGWSSSYPETTGYIVPTFIALAERTQSASMLERARRMLDWLVRIQFPEGGFQGGLVDALPRVPVTFNTGQILLGLAAGTAQFGADYAQAMHKAAAWLTETQDSDGCWRRHATPFAAQGEKAYETHVSWGLFEAARVAKDPRYADAALRNVEWALTKQATNGWFSDCCLSDPAHPLTHTIGYVLRGVNEAFSYSRDTKYLDAAQRTAAPLVAAQRPDGSLPGRLASDWQPAGNWVCLTGTVQIAHCWLQLFKWTGDTRFRDAAFSANRYVRRTVHLTGADGVRGGIKGSFPVDAQYGPYEFLNWAAKFFVDSNVLEKDVRDSMHVV